MVRLAVNDARAVKAAAVLVGVVALVLTTIASPDGAYGAARWGNLLRRVKRAPGL